VWLSAEPVASEDSVNLRWNESTDPVREGKGEDAKVPFREQ
jgi:hypothetical protein